MWDLRSRRDRGSPANHRGDGSPRKRAGVILLAIGALLLGGWVGVPLLFPGSPAASAIAAGGSSILQTLAARSPGERGSVALGKPQSAKVALPVEDEPGKSGPTQRALGKIFTPEELGLAPAGGPAAALAAPGVPLGAAPALAGLPGGGLGSAGGGGAGGGTGGGTGGGGAGGGGSAIGPPGAGVGPPTIPSGVPEPATWVMMILGVALAGGALRRGRRAARARAADSAG